jgi:hypothetical protein
LVGESRQNSSREKLPAELIVLLGINVIAWAVPPLSQVRAIGLLMVFCEARPARRIQFDVQDESVYVRSTDTPGLTVIKDPAVLLATAANRT